jgi:hypothetical protein
MRKIVVFKNAGRAMSIADLVRKLTNARAHRDAVIKTPMFQDPNWLAEYDAAESAVLDLERKLAALKGEEYAVPVDFPVEWDTGAPLPHVIQNDYKTFLTFYLRVPNPNWDGTFVKMKDPGARIDESLALVEFMGCAAAKLGSPNDEVFHGHPLDGKGMKGYTAQKVINSRWLAELEAINKVHSCYNSEAWRQRSHFVFWFHDKTFECIAKSFQVELFQDSMANLLAIVCERILS